MTSARKIWSILRGHVPRSQWISSKEIYGIVETHGQLDKEDRQMHSPLSTVPNWKIVVRDVLLNRLRRGKIRSRGK